MPSYLQDPPPELPFGCMNRLPLPSPFFFIKKEAFACPVFPYQGFRCFQPFLVIQAECTCPNLLLCKNMKSHLRRKELQDLSPRNAVSLLIQSRSIDPDPHLPVDNREQTAADAAL